MSQLVSITYKFKSKAEITQEFFATVQNKLHFAIHGHTAAELISQRANAEKDNMGLQTWKGGKVRKSDVTIAKNYLTESELKSLNRIVAMYLDYAEDQAERRHPMHMKDWVEKLNVFLKFNEREILENAGAVSKELADQLAINEYEKFHQQRLVGTKRDNDEDDFEKFIMNNRLDK